MVATDGFVRLPNWLIDDSSLSLHEMAVYTVLLRFRDHKTGKCYPGMATIADCARVSRETVKRTIPLLEKKGMVRVTRRREGTKNLPNVYEVALAAENPEFVWAKSERGRRIPKRSRGRHSETLPAEVEDEGRHSETLGRHSETPGVGTRSASNKTYKNKNQEQAVRQDLPIQPQEVFTFDQTEKATDKQLAYLSDLYIFVTERIPEQRTREKWTALDVTEASDLINTYWGQLDRGRGGMWSSNVDEIHSAYRALSPAGKQWVAKGYLPDALDAA